MLLATHNSVHNTPVINVQSLSISEQLAAGVRCFHIEFFNRSPQGCNMYAIHGRSNFYWPLSPLIETLNQMALYVNQHRDQIFWIILDNTSGTPPTSCLINTIKKSTLFPHIFPDTLQMGNSQLNSLTNNMGNFSVFLYFFSYNDQRNNLNAIFPGTYSVPFILKSSIFPIVRLWRENYISKTDWSFLGSTSPIRFRPQKDAFTFSLLDWNIWNKKDLFTTKVVNKPILSNGSLPVYIVPHFQVFYLYPYISYLYGFELKEHLLFLLDHHITPNIIFF